MKMRVHLAATSAFALFACSAPNEGAEEPAVEGELAEAPTAETEDAYSQDALVEGTDYHATTSIPCGFDGGEPTQQCEAGVKRDWDDEGGNLVEVLKPDGFKRAIFFNGTEPFGADSAQADGSAGWTFETSRNEDIVTIKFGPETYVIVDALVEGG